jgi:hypothetical protein
MIGDQTYETTEPLACGHRLVRAVYAYSRVAGRVAIDHYECAECPEDAT